MPCQCPYRIVVFTGLRSLSPPSRNHSAIVCDRLECAPTLIEKHGIALVHLLAGAAVNADRTIKEHGDRFINGVANFCGRIFHWVR